MGQLGVNLVERIVLAMGSRWTPAGPNEVGIDGYIELVDPVTRQAAGLHLAVQSKATERFDGDEKQVTFRCRRADIDYWRGANPPVLLIVSEPASGEAYWLSVSGFFGDPAHADSTLAVFDRRTRRFTERSYDALLEIARPPDQPVVRSPVAATETLFSNLLSVATFPSIIHIAKTPCTSYAQAWARLRESATKPFVTPAWALYEGSVFSFLDLASAPLSAIADGGTIEDHSSAEFENDPARRTLFVQLLNGALRDDLGAIGVRHYKNEDVFAFAGRLDEKPRKQGVRNLHRSTFITVVQHYVSKSRDGREFPRLRHAAFRGRFRRLDGAWYLEIAPTYRFTSDGRSKHRFHEDYLKGIKALEGNRAVLSQVLLWRDVLANPHQRPDLFARRQPILGFGSLAEFRTDRGVPDADWGEDAAAPVEDGDSTEAASLPFFGVAAKESP